MDDTTTDSPLLRKLDAKLTHIEDFLDLTAAAFIVFIMMFATVQVFSRKILPMLNPEWGGDLWGYIDIVVLVMATFSFLGIAYCQRLGGHIRMEILVRRLRGRTLWIAEALGIVVALIVMMILMWYGYEFFLRAFQLGDSTIDRQIPTWPSKVVVPIAFFVLNLRLILQLWGYFRLIANPDAEPIAVPVIERFEEMAQHEIEGALGEESGTFTDQGEQR